MGVLTGTTTAAFAGQVTGTGFTGTLDGILGSGTPAAATVTTIDASGVATATTFEPDGDTSAADNAAIGYTAAEGLILTGQGSTSDITLKNDADATVFSIPTGTDDILFPDNAKIIVGDSSDGYLTHDGTHTTLVDNGTGNLTLKSNGAGINFQKGDSETMCSMSTDGGVSLYYDNSTKFATTSAGATVTGNLSISEGGAVNISTPLLATTDHTATGLSAQMLAGGTIAAFETVCIHTVTGEVVITDASAFATARCIGIAPAAISDTATGEILLQGYIRDDTWNWTVGGTMYLSETAGDMTQTAPSTDGAFVQVLGIALTADVVYFNPSLDIIEHA
jgi:hypothetical protein